MGSVAIHCLRTMDLCCLCKVWDDIEYFRSAWLKKLTEVGVPLPESVEHMKGMLLCSYANAARKQGNFEVARSCLQRAAPFRTIPTIDILYVGALAKVEIAECSSKAEDINQSRTQLQAAAESLIATSQALEPLSRSACWRRAGDVWHECAKLGGTMDVAMLQKACETYTESVRFLGESGEHDAPARIGAYAKVIGDN